MGSSNENSAFGPVRNPWDLERVPGGSSGGSAAAVAAGEVVWALGTDTGGSVRQPASLCGVVGLKPTYGLVSRYGLIAFASSLDTVGTLTRSVRDAAVLLARWRGRTTETPRASTRTSPTTSGARERCEGLRVGVVAEAFGEGVEPGVRDSVRASVDRLQGLGASVGDATLPHAEYTLSAYYLIAPSEASSNLARYDGVRYGYRAEGGTDSIDMMFRTRGEGFGPEVKRRIMLGTYALSAGYYDAYYGQAQKVRTLIIRDYEKAFGDFDVLVSPTSPTTAFRVGEKVDDPMAMYLNDIFTIPANLAGVPAISVPVVSMTPACRSGSSSRLPCSANRCCSARRTRSSGTSASSSVRRSWPASDPGVVAGNSSRRHRERHRGQRPASGDQASGSGASRPRSGVRGRPRASASPRRTSRPETSARCGAATGTT